MRRLRILAFQIALGLLALEVCLRVYNPLPFRVRGDRIVLPVRQVYTFDNHDAPKLDPVTHHTKNSLGLRGPEPPRDFSRRLTILTIGGSTTECLFLSDGKTWTDVLARRIASAFPDAWVNNAGLDGQSTYGHLVLLQNFVVGLKPSIALFLVGTNDVGLDRSTTFDTALTPARGGLRALATFVADHVEVASAGLNLYRAARAQQRGFGHSQVDLTSAPRLVLDADLVDATIRRHAPYRDGFAERLARIAALCRSNEIDPIFVTQPALFGDAVDPATGVALATVQVNGRGNGALEWRLLESYNDVTRRVAAERQVFLIDLAREMPKDSRLFYDFLHFTNEGAARVGDIVWTALEPHLRERSR